MRLPLNVMRRLLGLQTPLREQSLLQEQDKQFIVPTPLSTVLLVSSRVSDGGSSQNLMLFIRENAISSAPIIRGTNQFPKPPIMTRITMKKIITKAWAVMMTL
jgi:hypothetical protein